ncbi:MAG TPA: hypothetical protein PL110_01610 [Candidatus Eremiobacteraeota bacterium]|nr:MAG: hypothetical protein BWY64_01703 [bacterium ADurb.Bin363]HPZ06785.1 hypothetical protein [Candidatus Eremiobacteraeota bacterium]
MKKFIIFFLFIILLAGCGSDDTSNPGTTSVVSGKVLEKSTQNPISGVLLTTNLGASVTSDSEGNFSFTFKSDSNYIISASKDDYKGSLAGGFASGTINHNIYLTSVDSPDLPVVENI